MDIQFNCPRCGQNLAVDETNAGITTDCPKCDHEITIPTRPPKAPVANPSQGAVPGSALAGWFTAFAVISFIAAGLAIFLVSLCEHSVDSRKQWNNYFR